MKSKNKHDHRLTNFLKVFIFMLVMLAPFFAIGVKCGYVMLNTNAVQSYRGDYKFDSFITVTNTDDYQMYIEYQSITSNNLTINNTLGFNTRIDNAPKYKYLYLNYLDSFDNQIKTIDSNNYNYDYIWIDNGGYFKGHKNDINSDTTITGVLFAFHVNSVKFELYNLDNTNVLKTNTIQYASYYSDTTLSSVFYSAVQELDKASIFSWTTNTAIYSGLLAMSEGLGVDTPPLAVLLTYWTIITSIYIIIDIILEMFIFLTHWLNDKIC